LENKKYFLSLIFIIVVICFPVIATTFSDEVERYNFPISYKNNNKYVLEIHKKEHNIVFKQKNVIYTLLYKEENGIITVYNQDKNSSIIFMRFMQDLILIKPYIKILKRIE